MATRRYGEPPFRAAVLHGGPGGIGSAAGLAADIRLRTGGILEPLQSKHSIAELIAELETQLAEYAPLALVGHSWGAWLATLFAASHPEFATRLVLVGCGALEESYAATLQANRMARLTPEQGERYQSILDRLSGADPARKNELLKQLGVLAEAADSFSLLPPERGECSFDGEMYAKVWPEAARMRRTGELLDAFRAVKAPIAIFHGDCDPSPAAGVTEPLRRIGRDFTFRLLPQCGHTPWKEKMAREVFFQELERELQA